MRNAPFVVLFITFRAICQTPSVAGQCRELLQTTLKDRNPDTRKEAAVALSLAGAREPYFSELKSMLSDKDVPVRLAAIASLADQKTKAAAAALRGALNDNVPEVSFAAAKALYGMNDPAGKEALLAVLSGESKISSGFISRQMRDNMRMIHTPKTMFLFALKQGVGFAPVPGLGEGISSMQGLLSDSGVSGRAMTALLLGKEKDRDTLEALREALTDRDWSVRAAAVHSLALRNDPNVQKDLEPLLADKKEAVRLRAAAAWLRLELVRKGVAAPGRGSAAKGE